MDWYICFFAHMLAVIKYIFQYDIIFDTLQYLLDI